MISCENLQRNGFIRRPDCGSLGLLERLELFRPTKDAQTVCEYRNPKKDLKNMGNFEQMVSLKRLPFRSPLLKSKDVFWYLKRVTSEMIKYKDIRL